MMREYKNLLKDQVAFITGGAQGIGGAAATAFARAGAKIYIVALGKEAIENKIAELRSEGFIADGHECDVSDYDGMCAAVSDCIEKFGKIDILYANAGVVLERKSVLESDPKLWKKTVEINLVGGYYTVRAALPYMIKNPNGGKILFTGTGRGRRASSNLSDYSCSKAGQWMLARCLAEELYEYNICVNEIVPGPVNTALNHSVDGEKANADLAKTSEINKDPMDLVELMLFVASQSNVTGPTGQAFALNRREL